VAVPPSRQRRSPGSAGCLHIVQKVSSWPYALHIVQKVSGWPYALHIVQNVKSSWR
jgi:hypothetical protein